MTSDSVDPPDLVVVDIARVEPDEVVDAWPDIPILGYTNHTDKSGLQRAHTAGFDQVIVKSALVERAPDLVAELIGSAVTDAGSSADAEARLARVTYIIAEPCIDIKDRSCVDVCPVDCIHEFERILIIDPEECIDCGACEPECPVEAIFPEDALPDKWNAFVEINYAFPDPGEDQRAHRHVRDRARRPERAARVERAPRLRPARVRARARVAGKRRRRDLRHAVPPLAVLDLGPGRGGSLFARRACSRPATRRRRGARSLRSRPRANLTMRRRGRNLDADRRAARVAHLGAEAAVEGRSALGERLEDRRAPLGRAVVGDHELGASACARRSEISIREGVPRFTACSIASRRIWYSATEACSPSSSACSTSRSISTSCLRRDALGERRDRRGEADLAQRVRLEVVAELTRSRAASRASSSPRAIPPRALGVALREVGKTGVEHLRDRGQLLDRPVVQELGETTTLLLLGEHALGEQRALGVFGVNRSSPREARSRPPACACRPRASRGCGARGSSPSPG